MLPLFFVVKYKNINICLKHSLKLISDSALNPEKKKKKLNIKLSFFLFIYYLLFFFFLFKVKIPNNDTIDNPILPRIEVSPV